MTMLPSSTSFRPGDRVKVVGSQSRASQGEVVGDGRTEGYVRVRFTDGAEADMNENKLTRMDAVSMAVPRDSKGYAQVQEGDRVKVDGRPATVTFIDGAGDGMSVRYDDGSQASFPSNSHQITRMDAVSMDRCWACGHDVDPGKYHDSNGQPCGFDSPNLCKACYGNQGFDAVLMASPDAVCSCGTVLRGVKKSLTYPAHKKPDGSPCYIAGVDSSVYETNALAYERSATCPYCTKTVSMSQAVLGTHRAVDGTCDGSGKRVARLEGRRAVFAQDGARCCTYCGDDDPGQLTNYVAENGKPICYWCLQHGARGPAKFGYEHERFEPGDRVRVEQRNGKIKEGVIAKAEPRTGVLGVGSREWLVQYPGNYGGFWEPESWIERA